jgi:hypothetical protein
LIDYFNCLFYHDNLGRLWNAAAAAAAAISKVQTMLYIFFNYKGQFGS